MKLPSSWTLPEVILQRFGDDYGKQRAMVAEGHLLLILHRLPEPGDRERKAVLFWRQPDGQWQSNARGKGLAVLRQHVGAFEKAEIELEKSYSEAQNATEYFEILETIAPLFHAARNLHSTLQAGREAIPADRDLIALRDDAAEIDRNLELLHQSARHGLDFEIAKQAEAQSRLSEQSIHVANRLNIIAAIFFPLTAIAGVFGMNLAHGLDPQSAWTFYAVVGGSFILGMVLKAWVMAASAKA